MENFPGKLLAIDHGEHVLGFATCDRIGLIAAPPDHPFIAPPKKRISTLSTN